MQRNAIVLANGAYQNIHGKTAHGLVRGSSRFRVLAVVDPGCAGQDAGTVLDGRERGIPLVASLAEAVEKTDGAEVCVVGMSSHGGRFTPELRALLMEAVGAGLSLVNGLHDYASDDPEIAAAAKARGLDIQDLRKPRPKSELRFWNGEIREVTTPRVAVLGTDCALGKRTTARFVVDALNEAGTRAEMIYTGQTGWMQGGRYGFVLDSVVNDYVCGELERAVLECYREASPEVMVIEGQSALRNPSGPCGAEFLLSGGARGVILQHAPGRPVYEGFEHLGMPIASLESEIELLRYYGARAIGVSLHGEGLDEEELGRRAAEYRQSLGIPVVRPLFDGVSELVEAVRSFIAEENAG